ncbi:flavo protein WrbA [Linderina pennispora]|uniref:Flavo protein WrbA n=1 Tax=Linderina pennispora TaxID=61395 RepID=A0A1Y1W6K8_9FUNG|nr:flavo protein WrbA [Linderina pennispora]ORX69159.1 flavo protein WrbA [Linderina pennispora]
MAKPKVFVIYYSTYMHVRKLAESVKEGLEKTSKVDVEMFQFPETLSDEILGMMHAPSKPKDVPEITVDKLPEADGYMFGFPTRFGNAPAQVKALFDATGGLWMSGALYGKPAGLFFSTGSQHGGQETTAMTFLPNLVHHGMIYVPIGFKNPNLADNSEVIGGSAWGAGTVAGSDGGRIPTEKELNIAEMQGEEFACFVAKLAPKGAAADAAQDAAVPVAAGAAPADDAAVPTAEDQKDSGAQPEPAPGSKKEKKHRVRDKCIIV